jgi:K+-transporting ATPase c subunit
MKLKENIAVRKIGNEYMMVSDSGSGLDYTRVISLNTSAAYLIEKVKHNIFTEDEWVELLIDKYDIEREIAEVDVKNLIEKLQKENLFES